MGILDLFRTDEVIGAKVLVCALEIRFEDLHDEDSEVYRRYYPATTTEILPTVQALLARLEQRYDICSRPLRCQRKRHNHRC